MSSNLKSKDLAAALVCILIGGFFSLQAVVTLPLGSARQMGPGYFPFAVGFILLALGLIIGGQALQLRTPEAIGQIVSLRAMLAILAAPVVFGLTVRSLGFVPAIILTALVATLGSNRANLARSLLLAAALTAFCVLVFSIGVGTNLPLFGPWFAMLGAW